MLTAGQLRRFHSPPSRFGALLVAIRPFKFCPQVLDVQRLTQCCNNRPGRVSTLKAKGSFAELESLRAQARNVQDELECASRIAEVAAKRSRRLADRSQELQAYALEHVMLGDECAARAALQQKAAVVEALFRATRRAEANSALARRLEEVLMAKQLQLLNIIRQAKEQADAAASTAAAACGAFANGAQGSSIDSSSSSHSSHSSPHVSMKRASSVGWSSPSMQASTDGFDETMQHGDAACY